MKKIEVHKIVRIVILSVMGLLMILSIYKGYQVLKEPEMVKEEVPVYSFQHQGKMDYQVQLKESPVFSGAKMHQDLVYYSKLVDQIDVELSYQYTAEQAAKIKVFYDVVAVVDVPEMWKREFLLVPETVVEKEGKELSFSEPFSFDLKPYQEYLDKVNEELGVTAINPKLSIQANVNVLAETAGGEASEKLIPAMAIPLSSGDFKIGGTLSPKESGALKSTEMVPNPGLKKRKVFAILFPGLMAVLLIATVLCTGGKEPVPMGEIEKILGQYGDRLVKAGKDFLIPDDLVFVSLDSIEELVKVADEAGKPLIFKDAGVSELKSACYVFDGLTVYRYTVSKTKDVVLQKDKETACIAGENILSTKA